MARRVKAQTINQITTKSTANKDDKILVSSTDGVVNSIELNKLSGLFGSGDGSGSGSGSGSSGSGSGSGSGSSGSGIIDVELNTLNSTTFYARKFEVNSISCDTTNGRIYSEHITIDEDSSIYASVYIQSPTLSAGRFGIEFKDASGNWFPVKSSHTIASTANGYEGSTEISFKAYSGCKLRAFIENGTTQFTTRDGIELVMYATAIKGSRWQNNSRTLTLTISQSNKANGLYISNPISFRHEGGSANFPEGYEGALVSVTGYFSLHATTKATVEETTNHTVHLQYKPKDGTWTNLTTVIVPATKQFCNFGTFFVERDSELRLASSHQPTTASINSPYFGCTGIIQYTAVNRKTDSDTGTDTEENATLSVLDDVIREMNDNQEAVTKFNFNIPTYASGTTDASQLATLRFNNLKFESNNAVIAWDPGIFQQISEDGIFWHQYGYGDVTGSDSSHSISATQLTSLGISTTGTALTFNLAINYGSITKGKTINGLTDVTIGTTVKNIDDYCFSDLSGLTSITIPKTCQTIGGNYTFARTITGLPSKLENITFDGTETSVATGELNHTFENLSALSSLNLSALQNVTKIKESTFTNCNGLTSIHIPNGCKDLDWKAFNKTPNLKTIILPVSLTAITNPTNRINGNAWYVTTIGIKLSGDMASYDINTIPGIAKITNEVQGIRNILATITDLKPTGGGVYAVILDKNGEILTTTEAPEAPRGYVLAFDCLKPDASGQQLFSRELADERF